MYKKLLLLTLVLSLYSNCFSQGTALLSAQQMPVFKGGNDSISNYMAFVLNTHPEFLSKISFSGKCYITFVIDEDGKMEKPRLIKGISDQKKMNEIILESLEKLQPWEAGANNGSNVRVALSYYFYVKQIGSKFTVKITDH